MKKNKRSLLMVGLMTTALIVSVASCGTKADAVPYDYDLSKYVTLGEYKGLDVETAKVKVTEAEIKDEINNRLEAASEEKIEEKGTVKDGDTITINFEGKIDGKTFDGGTAKDYAITIGTTPMIDGFTDGLIGAKVGDTVTLDLAFPDEYPNSPDLASKGVIFTVDVVNKKITVVPEYNLDFVKANSEATSLEDYEKLVKTDLIKYKESDADAELKNKLWQDIMAKSKVNDYPEVELKAKAKDLKAEEQAKAENYGMEYADYLKQAMQMTEEEFDKELDNYAKEMVGQEMVLYAIARAETLEVTDEEYNEYLDKSLKDSGFTRESFEKEQKMTIEEYGKKRGFKTGLLLNKVLDKVIEYGAK